MVAALQQTERKQNRIVGLVEEAAAVRRSGAVVGGVMHWLMEAVLMQRKWQMDVQRVKNKQNDGGVSVSSVEVKGRGCVWWCV